MTAQIISEMKEGMLKTLGVAGMNNNSKTSPKLGTSEPENLPREIWRDGLGPDPPESGHAAGQARGSNRPKESLIDPISG